MKTAFIIRSESILERAITFARNNWKAMSKGKHPLVIEFYPEATKRNIRQNRYLWAIYHQIEAQAWVEGRQYSAEVWHECAKRRFLGCIDLPGGGMMAQSTTDLSTKEFAEYVTKVEAWAQVELGVCLMDLEPSYRVAS